MIDLFSDGLDLSLIGMGADYFFDAVKKVPRQLFTQASNTVDSIQYLLYTPNNAKESCLLEPSTERFEKCSFNAGYETKFLVHGFVEFLTPENLLNVLKDAILEHNNYNVIVVNWTLYNVLPFELAYKNAKTVGEKMAEMMKFMQIHANVSLKSLHCIGHSLGCHVCGVAGRNVHALGRITGLDPGGLSMLKSLKPNIRLNYTDADFVDVMHTSDVYSLDFGMKRENSFDVTNPAGSGRIDGNSAGYNRIENGAGLQSLPTWSTRSVSWELGIAR
ncbi:Pancreatic lipase-related protein 2 [Araneus ventricosus]|uniref:Pancreatic lipase-related protein 2 n=1 Tax=Araneus ventricosus TaxID=182803 RepID=A0A4Y2KXW9_ARAVE|nr:Pancreatic lipase-related protein 2 [Araneus ventricosus]